MIKKLILEYLDEVDEAINSAGPADGIFGMGKSPKDDPCHERFYADIGKAVAEIKDGNEAFEAASELIRADKDYNCPQMASLMLTAVQGHVLTLLPLLNAEQKKSLKDYFDENIPRWQRLPVQRQLYKALKEV